MNDAIRKISNTPRLLLKKLKLKGKMHRCTNLYSEGLSLRRSRNKATLLFTTPCCLLKSSAKDLSPEILDFGSVSTLKAVLPRGALGRRSVQDTLFLLA